MTHTHTDGARRSSSCDDVTKESSLPPLPWVGVFVVAKMQRGGGRNERFIGSRVTGKVMQKKNEGSGSFEFMLLEIP